LEGVQLGDGLMLLNMDVTLDGYSITKTRQERDCTYMPYMYKSHARAKYTEMHVVFT